MGDLNPLEKKICRICKVEKLGLDFSPNRNMCKTCNNEARKAYMIKLGGQTTSKKGGFGVFNIRNNKR